jgi:hypothetical protein
MRRVIRPRASLVVVGLALATVLARCAAAPGGADMAAREGDASGSSSGGASNKVDSGERLLQESDIYKLVGDKMYILNRYRGFMVADVANREDMTLLGRLAMPATPREMWIHGTTALVIAAQQEEWGSGWGRHTADVQPMATYSGSALLAIDVTNPAEPTLAGYVKLGGDCFDGRLSGNVLYIACESSRGSEIYGSSHVHSINVADPRALATVESLAFERGTAEHHIYVNPRAIYLASVSGDTTIRYLDITSPDGHIQERGTISVPGTVMDRFSMDEWQGHLRVASGTTDFNGDAHVLTFDVRNPDVIQPVGSATLRVAEQLKSARFDGPRGYVVTFRNVDPLFTFDLSDPANPRLLGALEMTGWLDYMVPFGNRLVAMGHEDVADQVVDTGWGRWTMTRRTLAVSLVDVEGTSPRLLSRVVLDGQWGEIPADRDDFNKLFRVLKDQGLVIFPYRTFKDGYAQSAGMLLIEWRGDELIKRADLDNAGLVERGIPYDASTLLTLSVQALQSYDISDLSSPRLLSHVDLARQVTGYVVLDNGHAVEVSGDLGAGAAHLTARRLDELTLDTPVSVLDMDGPMGRVWRNGNLVYFASVHRPRRNVSYGYYDTPDVEKGPNTTVTVVDYADPTSPRVLSTLDVGHEAIQTSSLGFGYSSWWGSTTSVADAVQVDGTTLVMAAVEPSSGGGCMDYSYAKTVITVVDLSDKARPRVSGNFQVNNTLTQMAGGRGKAYLLSDNAVHVVEVGGLTGPTFRELKVEAIRPQGFPPRPTYSHAYQGSIAVSTDKDLVVAHTYSNTSTRVALFQVAGSQLREVASQTRTVSPYTAMARGDLMVSMDTPVSTLSTWTLSDDSFVQDGSTSISDFTRTHGNLRGLLAVDDKHAFVLWDDMVQLYDLSDRSRPTRKAQFSIGGVSEGASAHGDFVLVAAGYKGLVKHSLQDPL